MSLRDLLRDETLTSMSRAELLKAVGSSRLYFQRPDEPGFLVCETEGGPVVPVFTSCAALGLFAGPCGWASTTVADLVELLPEGVRALVDPLGPRTYVLDAKALEITVEQGEHDGRGRGTAGTEPR